MLKSTLTGKVISKSAVIEGAEVNPQQKKKASEEPLNHLHDTELRWFAIHTKFKSEKITADRLSKKTIEAYVPVRNSVRVYGKKK